jgi:Ribbon-helix-helix protein, copG family
MHDVRDQVPYTPATSEVCRIAGMRRIQIHIDEELDAAVAAEAARRGISKAALIRSCVARELGAIAPPPEDPWDAMIGWLDDDRVDDIDDVLYGPRA